MQKGMFGYNVIIVYGAVLIYCTWNNYYWYYWAYLTDAAHVQFIECSRFFLENVVVNKSDYWQNSIIISGTLHIFESEEAKYIRGIINPNPLLVQGIIRRDIIWREIRRQRFFAHILMLWICQQSHEVILMDRHIIFHCR